MDILSATLAAVLVFLTLWFQEGDLIETIIPENPIIHLDDNCTKLNKNEQEIRDYDDAINFVNNVIGSPANEDTL
jgi:hypothetical protein